MNNAREIRFLNSAIGSICLSDEQRHLDQSPKYRLRNYDNMNYSDVTLMKNLDLF